MTKRLRKNPKNPMKNNVIAVSKYALCDMYSFSGGIDSSNSRSVVNASKTELNKITPLLFIIIISFSLFYNKVYVEFIFHSLHKTCGCIASSKTKASYGEMFFVRDSFSELQI